MATFSLIISVINVFTGELSHCSVYRWDECVLLSAIGAARLSSLAPRTCFNLWIFIWLLMWAIRFLFMPLSCTLCEHDSRSRLHIRRKFWTCAICHNTNFLTVRFLFRVKYNDGWMESGTRVAWENNKYTRRTIHFIDETGATRKTGSDHWWEANSGRTADER